MKDGFFEAEILADSLSPNGSRLITIRARTPRSALNQWVRHRSMSFSVGSSRARPVKRQMKLIQCPIVFWGREKKGMVAGDEIPHPKMARIFWDLFGWFVSKGCLILNKGFKLHKQEANRPLEAFMFVDVVATGVFEAWEHFLALRVPHDAQPAIQKTAIQCGIEIYKSKPKKLSVGEWHLPYILEEEISKYPIEQCVKASAARVARTSYKNHDGSNCDIDKDIKLYEQLVNDKHMSPLEAQARATAFRGNGRLSGNLPGWIQHRKEVDSGDFLKFDWNIIKGVLDGSKYVV